MWNNTTGTCGGWCVITHYVALALPWTLTFTRGIQVPRYSNAAWVVRAPPAPADPGTPWADACAPDADPPDTHRVHFNTDIKYACQYIYYERCVWPAGVLVDEEFPALGRMKSDWMKDPRALTMSLNTLVECCFISYDWQKDLRKHQT